MFVVGYCVYIAMEVTARGNSYALMGVVGGLSLIFCGCLNDEISWDIPLFHQAILGGIIITSMEYITGWIDRMYLGWRMWDYSNMILHDPLGIVCVPFFLLWCVLAVVAVLVDDSISYYVYHSSVQPYYRSLTGKILFKLPERECHK